MFILLVVPKVGTPAAALLANGCVSEPRGRGNITKKQLCLRTFCKVLLVNTLPGGVRTVMFDNKINDLGPIPARIRREI